MFQYCNINTHSVHSLGKTFQSCEAISWAIRTWDKGTKAGIQWRQLFDNTKCLATLLMSQPKRRTSTLQHTTPPIIRLIHSAALGVMQNQQVAISNSRTQGFWRTLKIDPRQKRFPATHWCSVHHDIQRPFFRRSTTTTALSTKTFVQKKTQVTSAPRVTLHYHDRKRNNKWSSAFRLHNND